MSGIEPEEEIYIYIYKQRVGGLAVEEKMMKMVVVLVLVGSSATCTTHSKRRTHTIKRTKITARARARGQSCWAEGRGTIKCNVHIQMERLQFQIGERGAFSYTYHIQVGRGWNPVRIVPALSTTSMLMASRTLSLVHGKWTRMGGIFGSSSRRCWQATCDQTRAPPPGATQGVLSRATGM